MFAKWITERQYTRNKPNNDLSSVTTRGNVYWSNVAAVREASFIWSGVLHVLMSQTSSGQRESYIL